MNITSDLQLFFEQLEPTYENFRTLCDNLYASQSATTDTNTPKVTCTKGCGTCCHFPLIPATAGEAFVLYTLLSSAVHDTATLNEHLLQYARIYLNHARNKGSLPFTDEQQSEFLKLALPCPLLRTEEKSGPHSGYCGVYENRPVICDSFHSLDAPSLCAEKKPHRTLNPVILAGEETIENIRSIERSIWGRSTLGHLPLLLAALSTKAGQQAFLRTDFRDSDVEKLEDTERQAIYDFWLYTELLAALDYVVTEDDIRSLEKAQNDALCRQ